MVKGQYVFTFPWMTQDRTNFDVEDNNSEKSKESEHELRICVFGFHCLGFSVCLLGFGLCVLFVQFSSLCGLDSASPHTALRFFNPSSGFLLTNYSILSV